MGDLIADAGSGNMLDNLIEEANCAIVQNVLSTLSNREAEILRMRFGIDRPAPMTLEEIGKHYDLSRERIRQIENKALRKLRNPVRTRILQEAL